MKKTYLLKEFQCKEISRGTGSVKYCLVDDEGNERIVNAKAKLGLIKKIKAIEPIYHRETPLIDALKDAEVNDVLTIDFTEFNKDNPRVDSSAANRAFNRQLMKEVSPPHSPSFDIEPLHMMKLFGIAIIGFILLVTIKVVS